MESASTSRLHSPRNAAASTGHNKARAAAHERGKHDNLLGSVRSRPAGALKLTHANLVIGECPLLLSQLHRQGADRHNRWHTRTPLDWTPETLTQGLSVRHANSSEPACVNFTYVPLSWSHS